MQIVRYSYIDNTHIERNGINHMKNRKHPLAHLPKEIIRQSVFVCIFSAAITLVFDRLAFSLQWAKDYISNGHVFIGVAFLALYFFQDTFKTSLRTLLNEIQLSYEQQQNLALIRHATDVLVRIRGKVWRTRTNSDNETLKEIMNTHAMLQVTRGYLQNLWSLKESLPKSIIEILSGILMLWSFFGLLSSEVEHVALLWGSILLSSVVSVVISLTRIRLQRTSREKSKKASEEFDIALNDVFNLEPLNNRHAQYMTRRVKKFSLETFKIDKIRRRGYNFADIGDTFTRALAMLFIIGVKVYEVGISGVDLEFVASIVALSTIYAQILNRLHSIIRVVEHIKLLYDGVGTYSSDFDAIVTAWDQEETYSSDSNTPAKVNAVNLPAFTVSYRAQGRETPFSLKSEIPLVFKKGDVVLLTGPTGCGKTTLLRLASQNIRFDGVDIQFDFEKQGMINNLLYQSDCRLGSSNVLSELTFDEPFDENNLIFILKGLHLYEEILPKSENVLAYLSQSHIYDFSTGQRQRLAIARLLLNVDDTCHVIALDEATNALNDSITQQVLSFICEYCKNSIVLIASHQISIAQTFANHHLEFVPDDDGIFFKVKVLK